MVVIRSWKYRIYPTKEQKKEFQIYLYQCKNLWNYLLDYTKEYYKKTNKFPTRKQLYALTKKKTKLFSQVAQNIADKLRKALEGMFATKKKVGKAGFPRFKPTERMKSFTYPQFGFKIGKKLFLSELDGISIRKHRKLKGKIKTLTIKRMPSGKWYALFTSEVDISPRCNKGPKAGMDLGIEHFGHLSDDSIIVNPRHIKVAEGKLKKAQKLLSKKKKASKNRIKSKLRIARAHEKVTNNRRDFLHKTSRKLVNSYSYIAMEDLNVKGMSKGFLAKHILDCSWAEFRGMLHYKAEEAGSEIVLVDPAHTSQECSSCGLVRKKTLAERWHRCSCGASMHRDLNAAKNILERAISLSSKSRYSCSKQATGGRRKVKPVEKMPLSIISHNGQVSL